MRYDVVLDIECVGPDWQSLDETTRKYLTQRATDRARWQGIEFEDEEEAENVAAERLALDLGLARVIAIGVFVPANNRAKILLENTGEPDVAIAGGRTIIERGPEEWLLETAWSILSHESTGRVVTFNGRGYDGPILMTRSAQLGITIRRNLVPYRYDLDQACDLADVLGFQGAVRHGYNLDYWCRRFGVRSPKAHGMDGSKVAELYREGRMQEIAEYVDDDIRCEGELFVHLARTGFLEVFRGGPRAASYRESAQPSAGHQGHRERGDCSMSVHHYAPRHIIAAAPDLLEACKAVKAAMDADDIDALMEAE